jgi:hypothetical protein
MQVENSQNKMTFSKLTFKDGKLASNFTLNHYREVMKQHHDHNHLDRIEDVRFYINAKGDNEMCVLASKRVSGLVDFYYNYEFIDSSKCKFSIPLLFFI